jgi:hypothetical protein
MEILRRRAFMLKKSLILGCLLLLGVLILTGCPNPSSSDGDGTSTDTGDGGGGGGGGSGGLGNNTTQTEDKVTISTGPVTFAKLQVAFNAKDTVEILNLTGSTLIVEGGTVPKGKKLQITGPNTQIDGSKTLTVEGTLEVTSSGSLDISQAGSKLDIKTGGTVKVDGYIKIPSGFDLNTISPGSSAVIGGTFTVAQVNTLFEKVNAVEWDETNPFSTSNLAALPKWTGTKKLILTGATTALTANVTIPGALVITGSSAIPVGAFTLTAGASGIEVVDGGKISLSATASVLAGTITFSDGGILNVAESPTAALPDSVDLSKATVTTTTAAVTLKLSGEVDIGAIDIANDLTISDATKLTIDSVTNSVAKILNLAIPATIGNITTDTAALTLAGIGKVSVGSVTTDSVGLVITNTHADGVTIGTATIGADTSIDASNGKVVFGTADNNTTLTKATLASVTGGLASVGVNGAVALAYTSDGASITLPTGGTIETKGTASVTSPGLQISGDGTKVTGTGTGTYAPIIEAASGSTTLTINTGGGGAANNGILIGTAADGVQLLALAGDAMVYTFTASSGGTPALVSIADKYITAPAGTTAGAIIAATTADKAKIVLGTTSGGIKLGRGAKGGKLVITADSSGGSKIGVFDITSDTAGKLPVSVGVATTESVAEKVSLGTASSGECTVGANSTVTVFGATGSSDFAEIKSSLILES